MLESASDAVVCLNLRDEVIYWNRAAETLLGYSAKEMKGIPFALSTSGIKQKSEILSRVKSGETPGPFGFVYLHKDGSRVAVSVCASPVRNANRDIIGISKIIRALPDSAVQPATGISRAELENYVRDAQRLESVGQMARTIAHDFNNLLAVIDGYARMILSNGIPSPEIERPVGQILKAAERAAELIRQLRKFHGKPIYNLRSHSLADIADRAAPLLRFILGDDVHLRWSFPLQLPYASVDADALETVLADLALNARDALPTGGEVRLSAKVVEIDEAYVSRTPDAKTGRFICLGFQDTGAAVPAENLCRFFKPFFTTRENQSGLGLSLTKVHGIIKQHHGWITVASSEGQGTTLEIFLPVSDTPSRSHSPVEQAGSPTTSPEKIIGGTETILVVEEEATLRQLIEHVLQSHGYKTRGAGSAQEAMQIWEAQNGEFHLLLADANLRGEVNALELARRFCAANTGLKLVFTGTPTLKGAADPSSLFPYARTIAKPFHTHQLVETVFQSLSEKSRRKVARVTRRNLVVPVAGHLIQPRLR